MTCLVGKSRLAALVVVLLLAAVPIARAEDCAGGTFLSGGSCVSCPDGTFKPNTGNSSALCVACPDGSRSAAGRTACECLAPGATLSGNTCVCPCQAGTYPSLCGSTGAAICAACPRGYHCPGSCAAPVACPAGTSQPLFNATSNAACAACAAGSIALSPGTPTCTLCPAGSRCPSVDAPPIACARGTAAQGANTSCTPCASGEYAATEGEDSCTPCPAGHRCPDAAAAPIPCPDGTYSLSGSTSCASCPAGYSCTDPAAAPAACPDGAYSLLGWAACVACPPGAYCPVKDAAPLACPAGTFSVGGASACSPCAAGRYTGVGVTGRASCDICPPGHECPSGALDPRECAPGTFALAGQFACAPCPAGTTAARNGSLSCDQCPPGHQCSDSAADPEPCDLGYFAPGGAVLACELCPSGTRSAEPVRHRCLSCPAGVSCEDPRDNTTVCDPGFWSPRGSELPSLCLLCPAGTHCPDPAEPPESCTVGTYSPAASTTCTPCPAGSSCLDPAAAPVACPAGTYSALGDALCHPCPAGSACANPAVSPTACSSTEWSLAGAASCTACAEGEACVSRSRPPVRCGLGTYALAGSSSCTLCPAGSACPSTGLPPVPCPAGTYALGGASALQCIACPPGMACVSTSALPQPCPPGQFSTGGATACTACDAGFYCPSSLAAIQVPCPNGTYSLGGTSRCEPCPAGMSCTRTDSTVGQVACPAGTYSLAGQPDCVTCPAGFVCPATDGTGMFRCNLGTYSAAGEDSACTPCLAGFACPDPASSAAIFACPLGSYSLGSATACTVCPGGSACPSTTQAPTTCASGQLAPVNSTVCTDCPAGFRCPSSRSLDTEACPTGFFSRNREMECSACPAGRMCPRPELEPIACTAGFYAPGAATNCTRCPAGHFCASTGTALDGATVPIVCPAGTYALPGSTYCLPCTAGYICPAGSTDPEPVGNECPIGYYCSVASGQAAPHSQRVVETPCPAGTRGFKRAGISQADACETCPPSYFCPAASTRSSAQACVPGRYCPGGSGATGTACSAGRYNSLYGSSSVSDCLPCPPGYYCPSASASPTLCAQGYVCAGSTTSLSTLCPAGRFGGANRLGLIAASECLNCTAGYYCPADTASGFPDPRPCPAGTFNARIGQGTLTACTTCPAGFYCPNPGTAVLAVTCSPGRYCPAGTGGSTYPTPQLCPAGTMYHGFNGTRVEDCVSCPERFACASGTGGAAGPGACTPGYYCREGTRDAGSANVGLASVGVACASPLQCPCPPGRYGSANNLRAADECLLCPPGSYCAGGLTVPSGPCAAGYFCPNGTASAMANPCPAGTYSTRTDLVDAAQCTPCPTGHYCFAADTVPRSCPAGTYSNVTNAVALADCYDCPAGWFCASSGTVHPAPCTTGFHSATRAQTCSSCQAGHFCPFNTTTTSAMLTTLRCDAGLLCAAGVDVEPDRTNHPCPPGRWCPEATVTPQLCPAGTYNPFEGGSSDEACLICPAGSFCDRPGLTAVSGDCATGFFCPAGSVNATAVPCPAKFYRNQVGGRELEDCALCPSGSFCERNTTTPRECPAGTYCITGMEQPEPCPVGSFGNATAVRRPEDCTPCPPGFFCEIVGLTSPSGPCDAGYFCLAGSHTRAPVDDSQPLQAITTPIGGICPPGGFCPIGSSQPRPCPAGTFSNVTGAPNDEVCLPCIPGSFCQGTSNPFPSGLCDPGYYCSGGASDPRQHTTPAGYFSIAGSDSPLPCPRGTFNNLNRQPSCFPCLSGRFCNDTATIVPRLCPPGSFCPPGTADPLPCPAGTFSTARGLENSTACSACTPGYFCETPGLTQPEGQCDPGFYCTAGSPVRNPGASLLVAVNASYEEFLFNATRGGILPGGNESQPRPITDGVCVAGLSFGGPCPPGHYCLSGTVHATQYPCPAGTFNPIAARDSSSDCLPCPAGEYCGEPGLARSSGRCSAGFYCTGGASDPQPSLGVVGSGGGACGVGTYCPEGSSVELDCPPGTFSNTTGLRQCFECPARYMCDGSTPAAPQPCPPGRYCPSGTGAVPRLCPLGTFSSRILLATASECEACRPGVFCGSEGLTAPSGDCAPGFFCPGSAADPYGRFRNSTGSVCEESVNGTVVPNDVDPTVWAEAVTGGSPLVDFFTGRPGPRVCPPGTYCPAGSSTPQPCPVGRFVPTEASAHRNDCLLCPAGSFCATQGLAAPTGVCAEGFFCARGNAEAAPRTGTVNFTLTTGALTAYVLVGGNICPTGTFCPNGSTLAHPCRAGTYNPFSGRGLAGCLTCPSGFFCEAGASRYDNRPCPVGYFCPPGTSWGTQFPCPAGTFSNQTLLRTSSECISCPGGEYCPGPADTRPSGLCDAGYYCRGGASTPRPLDGVTGDMCRPGEFCTAGSHLPRSCEGGKYCQSSSGVPDGDCFAGYYCVQGSFTPTPRGQNNTLGLIGDLCPAGHFCPNGTITPRACPAGSFSAAQGNTRLEDCQACTAGFFCNASALTEPPSRCFAGYYCPTGTRYPSLPCPPGHLCVEGSDSPVACPAGQFQAFGQRDACDACPVGFYCTSATITPVECPEGFYCPESTPVATWRACPAGTFSPVRGLQTESQCRPCPGGQFCVAPGLTAPSGQCAAGHYCLGGSPVAGPADGFDNGYVASIALGCAQGNATLGACQCDAGGPDALWLGLIGVNITDEVTVQALPTRGDLCPRGHFCPLGSSVPTPCPQGTYSSRFLAQSLGDCEPCTAGFFCPNASTVSPTQLCLEGFYCPAGRVQPTHLCPSGHECPRGSSVAQPCPAGRFQASPARSSCDECPAGFWCGGTTITPMDCPAGFYCPAGSNRPDAWACPAGTFSNETNLEMESECSPCPPGQYCALAGLTSPQGECDAGFYCVLRSPTPNPGANHTVEAVATCASPSLLGSPAGQLGTESFGGRCPAGAFCPSGSSAPQLCPAGTFSNATTNQHSDDCLACPARYVCPSRGTIVPEVACPEGFFCPGGQASGAEHPCPRGHFCPGFVASPIPCTSGSFQNQTEQGECEECPAGFGCEAATEEPALCSPGFYCAAGSENTTAEPCPEGTWSNRSGLAHAGQCSLCPAGLFCQGRGNTQPTGPCGAGHYCTEGSFTPTPRNASHRESLVGGECAVGYVCTYGSWSATPHHPDESRLVAWPELRTRYGQLSPASLGARTADLVEALVAEATRAGLGFATALEPDGVVIGRLSGVSTCSGQAVNGSQLPLIVRVNPLDPPVGYACPPGTHCPQGATAPSACPPGTYAREAAAPECEQCPAGFVCSGATDEPASCPRGHFCEAGSASPVPCPPGSFGSREELTSASLCSACPPGVYCSNGDITGVCAGGFVCRTNSSVPNPGMGTTDFALGHGYPCPAGYYCPNGTVVELPCPLGRFSSVVGASTPAVCGACPAGAVCTPGSPTAAPCPRGHYCPGNSVIIACNATTYNPNQGGTSPANCISCPAGTLCTDRGIVTAAAYPCPAGHFCGVGAAVPLPCPAARFRASTGGTDLSSCAICTAGGFCGIATVTPAACLPGHYCPAGSATPVPCEPGRLCAGSGLSVSQPCPPGFFCPNVTAYASECPAGTYCVGSNHFPVVCPPGTVQQPATSPLSRTSFEDACRVCPAGTYSDATDGLDCRPCTPGYVCLGATIGATPSNATTERGYPCPSGHYCPEGSQQERPCPAGTYNPLSRRSGVEACLACRVNSYNPIEGQATCLPCSASAFTLGNSSTTCQCVGAYRHFQPTDGACVCQPGYEFLDEEQTVLSEADGVQDCQPQTFDFCEVGESRTAAGTCAVVDCTDPTVCTSGRGEFVPSMGLCACEGLPPVSEICDAECQAAIPRVQIHPVTGRVVITDPETGSVSEVDPAVDIPGFVGQLGCVTPDEVASAASGDDADVASPPDPALNVTACRVLTMVVAPATGFTGVYAAPVSVTTAVAGSGTARRLQRRLARTQGRRLGRLVAGPDGIEELADEVDEVREPLGMSGRRLRNTPRQRITAAHRGRRLTTSGPAVARPAVCAQQGDSVLFELANGADSIPVYVKDSFLNTNAGFDYGEFRRLAALAAVDDADISVFGFTFRENGTYVFSASSDPSQQMVVVIMPAGQTCPTDGPFSPPSRDALVQLGVEETSQPSLAPNWRVIGALLGGLLAVIVVVLGSAWYFRHRAFGQQGSKDSSSSSVTTVGGRGVIIKRGIAQGASKFAASKGHRADDGGGGEDLDGDEEDGSRTKRKRSDKKKASRRGKSRREKGKQSGGDQGSDSDDADDAWDSDFDDDISSADVRVLLDALRDGQDAAGESFAAQTRLMRAVMDRLRDEAEGLRRMLADAAVRSATSTATSRDAAVRAARRAAVIRQLEAEIAARALHDRHVARLSAEIITALRSIERVLRNDPHGSADVIVTELDRAARDAAVQPSTGDEAPSAAGAAGGDPVAVPPPPSSGGQAGIASVAATVAAMQRIQLEDSLLARELSAAMTRARESVRTLADVCSDEARRRGTGVSLWQRAVGADVFEGLGSGPASSADSSQPPSVRAMREALESLEEARAPLDAATATLLEPLLVFERGASMLSSELTAQVRSLRTGLASAMEQQNPAVAVRIRSESAAHMEILLADLCDALRTLMARLPFLSREMDSRRTTAEGAEVTALPALHRARLEAEAEARRLHLSSAGVQSLLERVEKLIADARKGKFYYGGAYAEPDSSEDGSDAEAVGDEDHSVGSAAGREGDGGHGRSPRGGLLGKLDQEAEAEAAAIRARLEAERRAREAEEAAAEERKRREAEERLRQADMDERRRKQLLDEYEADRARLAQSMEDERRRQEEEMQQRLQKRKDERMRQKMRRAEAEAATLLEARRREAELALQAKQEEDRRALQAALQAEEAEERRRAAATAGAGAEAGVVDSELAAQELRASLRRQQEEAQAAAANARQGALDALEATLRDARDLRVVPLPAAHEAALASLPQPPAPGSLVARRRALESHREEWATADRGCSDAEDDAARACVTALAAARDRAASEIEAAAATAVARCDVLQRGAETELQRRLDSIEATRAAAADRAGSSSTGGAAGEAVSRIEAESRASEARAAAEAAAEAAQLVIAAARAEAAVARAAAARTRDTMAAQDTAAVELARTAARGERGALVARGLARVERDLALLEELEDALEAGGDEALRRLWARHREQRAAEDARADRDEHAGDDADGSTDDAPGVREARRRAAEDEAAARRRLEGELEAIRRRHDSEFDALRDREASERGRQAAEARRKRLERRDRWETARRRREQAAVEEAARSGGADARRAAEQAVAAAAAAAAAGSSSSALAAEAAALAGGEAAATAAAEQAVAATVSHAVDAEAEARRLHERHAREVEAEEQRLRSERRRQEAALQRRLADRRARRERQLEQARQDEAQAASRSARDGGLSAADQAAAAAAMAERMAQEADRARAAAEETDAQEREALAASLREREEAVRRALREKEATAEEEAARIRAAFDSEAERLAAAELGEKRRQRATMETRLRQRRERQERDLRRRQQQEAADQAAALAAEASESGVAEAVAAVMAAGASSGGVTARELFDGSDTGAMASTGGRGDWEGLLLAAVGRAAAAGRTAGPAGGSELGAPAAAGSHSSEMSDGDGALKAAEEAERRRLASIEEDARREREELLRRQEEERRAAAAAAAEDAAREAEERASAEEEERRRAADIKRRELEARLRAANAGTAEEAARLREQFEEELRRQEAAQDEERRRQAERLEKQLAARRERQDRALKRKQEKELAEAAERAAEKAREAKAEAEREREREALRLVLLQQQGQQSGQQQQSEVHSGRSSGQPSDPLQAADAAVGGGSGAAVLIDSSRRGEAVEVVMQERHARETSELLARQYAERAAAIRAALEDAMEDKMAEKAELVSSLQSRGASDTEVDEALRALDARWETERSEREVTARESLEVAHARAQLALRQRQLGELRDALSELAPEEVLRRREAEDAAREAEELRKFQEDMERERADRIDRARRDKQELEERLRRENEEEMRRLESDHAEQLAAERERQERALEARRERLAREQDEARKRAMNEATLLDDEARQRILEEFDMNQRRVEEKLEQQKEAQEERLRRRLEARRARRERQMAEQRAVAAVKLREAEEAARRQTRAEEEARRREVEERMRREAEASAASAAAASAVASAAAGGGAGAGGAGAVTSASITASAAAARSAVAGSIARASRRAMSQLQGVTAPAAGSRPAGRGGLEAIGEGAAEDEEAEADVHSIGGASVRSRGTHAAAPISRRASGVPGGVAIAGAPLAGGIDVPALARRLAELEAAMQKAVAAATAATSTDLVPADAGRTARQPGSASAVGAARAVLPTGVAVAEAVADSSLTAREMTRLEFARRVVAALSRPPTDPLAGVSLRVAATLPPAEGALAGSPYAGALHYVSSSRQLFVARRLLQSAGELMMALCHAGAALGTVSTSASFGALGSGDYDAALRACVAASASLLFKVSLTVGSSSSSAPLSSPAASTPSSSSSVLMAASPGVRGSSSAEPFFGSAAPSSSSSAAPTAVPAGGSPGRTSGTPVMLRSNSLSGAAMQLLRSQGRGAASGTPSPVESPPPEAEAAARAVAAAAGDAAASMRDSAAALRKRLGRFASPGGGMQRSMTSGALRREGSGPRGAGVFRDRVSTAIGKIRDIRRMGLDVKQLLHATPMLDESDRAGIELDVEQSKELGSSRFVAGSVSERVARVRAFGEHPELSRYLAQLERDVVTGELTGNPLDSSLSPMAGAASSGLPIEPARSASSSHDGSARGYIAAVRAEADAIDERLNASTRSYLERQRDLGDLDARLSKLQDGLAAQERTLSLATRIAASVSRRQEAAQRGEAFEEPDEELRSVDPDSLPEVEELEKQVEATRASIAETERARDRLRAQMRSLTDRQASLETESRRARAEAERLEALPLSAVQAEASRRAQEIAVSAGGVAAQTM